MCAGGSLRLCNLSSPGARPNVRGENWYGVLGAPRSRFVVKKQQQSLLLASPVHLQHLADKAARESLGGVVLHWVILDLVVERVHANLRHDSGPVYCTGRPCDRLRDLCHIMHEGELASSDWPRIEEIGTAALELQSEWQALLEKAWGMDADCGLIPLSRGYHRPNGIRAEPARRLKSALWHLYWELRQVAALTRSERS